MSCIIKNVSNYLFPVTTKPSSVQKPSGTQQPDAPLLPQEKSASYGLPSPVKILKNLMYFSFFGLGNANTELYTFKHGGIEYFARSTNIKLSLAILERNCELPEHIKKDPMTSRFDCLSDRYFPCNVFYQRDFPEHNATFEVVSFAAYLPPPSENYTFSGRTPDALYSCLKNQYFYNF